MEPSWIAKQWIKNFEPFSMGEPLIPTRSDLPEDDHINNQLGRSTTTPVAATDSNLHSSECVVTTIWPIIQLSLVQQNSSQCVVGTIWPLTRFFSVQQNSSQCVVGKIWPITQLISVQ